MQKATVLCVDDDALGLQCRSSLLSEAGYEVLTAQSGPQALEIFATSHVDLAVLDYAMPEMDGGAVAGKLKTAAPQIPVLMVSGHSQIPAEAMRFVDEFLSKGEAPTRFLSSVRDLLAKAPLSRCVHFHAVKKRLRATWRSHKSYIRHCELVQQLRSLITD
jgi:CheY-like chemotaxis protein